VFPDATPQETLGSKFIFWQLYHTGHSLRQSTKKTATTTKIINEEIHHLKA
jgi:hypothetical protein